MFDLSGFSPAELSALRLDGDVFAIFEAHVLADEPDTLAARIRLARGDAPPSYILDGESAAWVWEALPLPPRTPQFCLAMNRRSTDRINRVKAQHYVQLEEQDIVSTESGSVLSPWRTLLHVLRWAPTVPDACITLLLSRAGETVHTARARIESRYTTGQRSIYLRRLERIEG
ncbi:MAG TPA: hypothetical protein VK139_02425 [Microbacteriaceae bacterium]|nr:hypothetical protein [Microbacteriaceae bacterium]